MTQFPFPGRPALEARASRAMRAAALLLLAALGGIAWAQPAQGPSPFELVRSDGTRHAFATSYVRNITLLPGGLAADGVEIARERLRYFCARQCPADLGARPRQDVVRWRDGRSTTGYVTVYRSVVGQDGRAAGILRNVEWIQIGTAQPGRAFLTRFRPGTVEVSGGRLYAPSAGSGEYVVFQEPWLTLDHDRLTIQGHDPIPRGEIRFLSHSGQQRGHFADPPVAQDTVLWSDGSRTIGPVTISNGRVAQPRLRPRPFRDVRSIELAPAN